MLSEATTELYSQLLYQHPKMLGLNMASSMQPRVCVYKGTGMLLSGRMLMKRPGFESQHCKLCVVSVCARVCIAVASVCLSVLRFESLGFYKSRCHFHSLSVSLILSQPLHLLVMGASNGALRYHPISSFLFTLHPFASSCQGRPSVRSGRSRSQC